MPMSRIEIARRFVSSFTNGNVAYLKPIQRTQKLTTIAYRTLTVEVKLSAIAKMVIAHHYHLPGCHNQ